MKMTFDEYIQNPQGRKNAVFSQREMFRELYAKKLDALMVRENGKIDYKLYILKDLYYIHFKIPSETVEKFYYDVVIKFIPNGDSHNRKDLKDYHFECYSNDPSFVFTFAHSFIKNELFISELKDKMSKEAIKKNADERNPDNIVGYVKSLYFAYLVMRRHSLFDKILFTTYATKIHNVKDFINNIEEASTKINKRIEEAQKIEKSKRIQKNKDNKIIDNSRRTNIVNDMITKTVGRVGTINSINNSNGNIKETRRAKKIKRIGK